MFSFFGLAFRATLKNLHRWRWITPKQLRPSWPAKRVHPMRRPPKKKRLKKWTPTRLEKLCFFCHLGRKLALYMLDPNSAGSGSSREASDGSRDSCKGLVLVILQRMTLNQTPLSIIIHVNHINWIYSIYWWIFDIYVYVVIFRHRVFRFSQIQTHIRDIIADRGPSGSSANSCRKTDSPGGGCW